MKNSHQPRYGSPSAHGEGYSSAAIASSAVGAAGGTAWALGQRKRKDAVKQGAANRNFGVIRRAGAGMRSEADNIFDEVGRTGKTTIRQEKLATRTRARLTPVTGKVGSYAEKGRRGFYPSKRLKTLDSMVDAGKKKTTRLSSLYQTKSQDSRNALKQAGRMERDFGSAARSFTQSKKVIRGGKIATLAGLAGAAGFGIAAEKGRGKPPKKTAPKTLKQTNVVDLNQYRRMSGTPDKQGASLVDASGYRKQVPSAATWLKNNGGK